MTSPRLDHRVRSLEEVKLTKLLDELSEAVRRLAPFQHTQLPECRAFHRVTAAEQELMKAVKAFGGGE